MLYKAACLVHSVLTDRQPSQLLWTYFIWGVKQRKSLYIESAEKPYRDTSNIALTPSDTEISSTRVQYIRQSDLHKYAGTHAYKHIHWRARSYRRYMQTQTAVLGTSCVRRRDVLYTSVCPSLPPNLLLSFTGLVTQRCCAAAQLIGLSGTSPRLRGRSDIHTRSPM